MSVWETQGPPVPEGVKLAHTFHGVPQDQYLQAHTAVAGGLKVIPARSSVIPYEPEEAPPEEPPDRSHLCQGKDGTCNSYPVHGSEFCRHHQPPSTVLTEGDPEEQPE